MMLVLRKGNEFETCEKMNMLEDSHGRIHYEKIHCRSLRDHTRSMTH